MSSDNSSEEEKKRGSPEQPTSKNSNTPKSSATLSPSGRTPQRVQSSNSLFGEDIVNSGRTEQLIEQQTEQQTIASYSDDEQTTTPPSIHSGIPPSFLPPPLLPTAVETFLNSSSSVHSQPSTSKVKPGRPPRAPSTASNTQQPLRKDSVPKDHKRVRSTGEFSFMSALTDPSDLEERLEERDRAVTWDDNFFDVPPVSDQEIPSLEILQQPVLVDEPPRSIRTLPPAAAVPKAQRKNDRDNISSYGLTDIVSPMESEAETAIMKALEDRERKLMRSSEAVLPNLPDEALNNFLAPPISVHQTMPETPSSSNTELPEAPAVNSPTLSGSAKGSVKSAKGSPNRSSHSIRSHSNKSHSNRIGLDKQASKKVGHHQRTNTHNSSDLTLYGLATMMRNIQRQSNDEHGKEKIADNHRNRAGSDAYVEEPISASDTLANQAALLFRGKLSKEPGQMHVTNFSDEMDPKKNDDIQEAEEWEERSESDIELGIDLPGSPTGQGGKSPRRRTLAERFFKKAVNHAKDDFEVLNDFFEGRRKTILTYTKSLLLYLFLPALGIACLFYYVFDNPILTAAGNDADGYPSISWFILFICIRQLITFSFAKMTEIVIIDFLALKTRIFLKIFGPLVSLMVVQSRGWPFIMTWWAFYDLCMLTGDGPFANHWLFYQNAIGVFNDSNPSGSITSSVWNYRVLIAGLIIGVVVAIKRFVVGLYLGGRQYRKLSWLLSCCTFLADLSLTYPCQFSDIRSQIGNHHSQNDYY